MIPCVMDFLSCPPPGGDRSTVPSGQWLWPGKHQSHPDHPNFWQTVNLAAFLWRKLLRRDLTSLGMVCISFLL